MNTRTSKQFTIPPGFVDQLTHWAGSHEFGVCFRGTGWGEHFGLSFQAMAAVGIHSRFSGDVFQAKNKAGKQQDYLIAHLAYDVKNRLEDLRSENPDHIGFAETGWTVPELVVTVSGDTATFEWHAASFRESRVNELFRHICRIELPAGVYFDSSGPGERMSKATYLQRISQLQRHIQRGDVYQSNICQEFYWENASFSPAALFNKVFAGMPNPFSAFYKYEGKYCLCFSPERFLTFNGTSVLSQPMKGTAPRSHDPLIDRANAEKLRGSEKDRRENVMIVDMVRHDLSRFAARGSVKVPELYHIRTYPKVHQMYSTVTAEIRPGSNIFDVLFGAFPMGSMTGAPKVRAMQLIEALESSKRGLFSGTIGFVTPAGHADFNVVIRSLLYNPAEKYLSCHVGGGITALSNAEDEYEECLVKFEPIRQLIASLEQKTPRHHPRTTFAE